VPPRDVAVYFDAVVPNRVHDDAKASRKATGYKEPTAPYYGFKSTTALPRGRLPGALEIARDIRGALGVAVEQERESDTNTGKVRHTVEEWGETVTVSLPSQSQGVKFRLYVLVFPYDEEARQLVISRLKNPDTIFHPVK
jgi:hypothetical protein